jgi:energy-converting hydrogenase A subunit R
MGLVENGHKIFEAISRYDDILTLEGRENYEPGDTLALILPFLLYHNVNEDAISEVSKKAFLVDGAKTLVACLKDNSWKVYIISTSYEQHAHNIGSQLGVNKENIYCTRFPLSQFRKEFEGVDLNAIKDVEQKLLEMHPLEGKDEQLKSVLDKFYWHDLIKTPLGNVITKINVVGGERKVDAAKKIAGENKCSLGDITVVGDSITDFKMLKVVHDSGGLAVAFNANVYAVPYATISLASENLNDLWPILNAWASGGRTEAISELENQMTSTPGGEKFHFHNLEGKNNFDDILEIHKKYRALVRGKAAKLG